MTMKENRKDENQKGLEFEKEEREGIEPVEREPMLAVPAHEEIEAARRVDIEKVIDYAEKKVELYKKIRIIALKATNESDWIIQKDGPYLMERGAAGVANLFGVDIPKFIVDREWSEDDKGRYYTYVAIGSAYSRSLGRWVSDIGTCSQRDKLFGMIGGELRPMEEVDVNMIKKKAVTNLKNRLVKGLCGILNVIEEDLIVAGLDPKKMKRIEYKTGTKRREAALTKEVKELRDKLWKMMLELTAGAEEAAKAVLEKHSAFETRDGRKVVAKSKEDLASEKWIKATYGRVKKEYDKAFGEDKKDD